jgi:tRNA pseudouridine38-40 synthase
VRVALGLEYDGSGFRGWQIQSGARSVQACVESSLSRVADHGIRAVCAGRTDTGVHALSQVVHFDTVAMRDERAWVFGGNTYLPSDVSILWARRVPDDFHARYSATARVYRYVILNRPARPGLFASRVTWEYRPLCETLMREAACYLLGEHDFSAFRAQGCQAEHAVRTVHRLEVDREEDRVSIEIEANAFLYHMVRNIAGVLMAIGRGIAAPVWARQVLEARRRAQAGVTAPASGLYLTAVRYPPPRGIPGPGATTFSRGARDPVWVR